MRHLAAVAFVLVLSSCKSEASPPDAKPVPRDRGPLVAKVGTVEIHEDDVKRAMARDPGATAVRFEAPEARAELIDGLVRFELLAQAAERGGYTKDPDAIHALHQIAVTKLVNDQLGGKVGLPESITQEELKREYDSHQAKDFTLPGAAHVRHLRVSDAKLAEKLVAQARALKPEDDEGFAKLATANTQDEATRAVGGDLGFLDVHSRISPYLEALLPKLQTPGEVFGPIETHAGFEIVRLVSLRAPVVSPLPAVQQQLRMKVYQDRRTKALDDYIAQLRKETPVEVLDPKAKGAAPAASHP